MTIVMVAVQCHTYTNQKSTDFEAGYRALPVTRIISDIFLIYDPDGAAEISQFVSSQGDKVTQWDETER